MAQELKKGLFICFEGPEGSGKSTHSRRLAGELEESGFEVEHTFEPGGTPAGRKIRHMLLSDETVKLHPETELLLFEADRAQHVRQVVLPALDAGKIVICDRYSMATMAYQGAGLGLPEEELLRIDDFATGVLAPELTILLDVEVDIGLERASGGEGKDKMERREREFHSRVRKAYLEFAARDPNRVKVVKTSDGVEDVYSEIRKIIYDLLGRYSRTE